MKIYIPCADADIKTEQLTGKGFFCYRLAQAMRIMGVDVIGSPKAFVDVSLNIIHLTHTDSKVKLLRLAGVWHDTGKKWAQKNLGMAESLRRCDGVVYQTNFAKMMCNKYLGVPTKPFKVIFNGADPEFYKNILPANMEGKKVVLAFSRWRPHKRLRDIIESFLLTRLKDVVLLVAGDLSGSGLTREEHEKYFKLSNVKYLGIINQTVLGSYLNMASASIHLCWVDGCPNSVVEAITAKVPVICNNVGGVQELVTPSDGFVCDVDKPYDMNPVDLYHPPPIDRRKIAEKIELCCRGRMEIKNDHVLIENVAKQYLDFICKLVNGT